MCRYTTCVLTHTERSAEVNDGEHKAQRMLKFIGRLILCSSTQDIHVPNLEDIGWMDTSVVVGMRV